MRRHIFLSVTLSMVVWSVAPLRAASSPATVSPGSHREVIRVEARCPAFSWGAVEGAGGYELVVYRLPASDQDVGGGELSDVEGGLMEAEASLRERLPAGALSWTPSMDRCLTPGGRYAWLVRADVQKGESDWSEPRLFEVVAGPSPAEVEQALAVLQAYLAAGGVESGISGKGEIDPPEPVADPLVGDVGTASGTAPEAVPAADVTAILGQVPDPTGVTFGLHGISASIGDGSTGVVGESTAASGATVGVLGEVDSAAGVAGAFDNTAGGQILSGRNNGAEVFGVDGAGNVAVGGTVDGIDVAGHAANANAHHVPPTSLPPSGAAGGDLSGTFPDPDVVDDSHSHTGTTMEDLWVDETGDTMTGPLVLSDTDVNLSGTSSVLKDGTLFLHQPTGTSLGLGRSTLFSNTTGLRNTATGFSALYSNTSGSFNTAEGALALAYNTTGNGNTAIGHRALYGQLDVSTGNDNTATGRDALWRNTTGSDNTATGSRALRLNTTGNGNTASGSYGLFSNEGGSLNTASGKDALRSNTSGSQNTANGAYALATNDVGAFNTASGTDALRSNTSGIQNTASGHQALKSNTTGFANTATGDRALFSNTAGYRNTAAGYDALYSNDTGAGNTAAGDTALRNNSTGLNNTANGLGALLSNDTGDRNTASGSKALYYNVGGHRNTALGDRAGYNATTGSDNIFLGSGAQGVAGEANTIRIGGTAVGAGAGQQNRAFINGISGVTPAGATETVVVDANGQLGSTTGGAGSGLDADTLDSLDSTAFMPAGTDLWVNTTGDTMTGTLTTTDVELGGDVLKGGQTFLQEQGVDLNVGLGRGALNPASTGAYNVAVGREALSVNNTGYWNTASGRRALYSNTSGYGNTATGHRALQGNIDGIYSTASGYAALGLNDTGFRNTAIGAFALGINTSGARNTAVGHLAGSNVATGSDNIFVGNNVVGEAADSNTIRIGGGQSRTFVAGISGVTTDIADAIPVLISSSGQLGTVSSSKRYKKEIADMGGSSEGLLELRPVTFKYKQEPVEGEQPLQYGLIAEEVADLLPDLVIYDQEGRPQTVRYHLLSSLLLNELQKQHGLNLEQEEEIGRLRKRLQRLEAEERQPPPLSERRPPPSREAIPVTEESVRR